MTYAIIISIRICMWNPSVVSWLDEKGCAYVKHIGQHICFGVMCDIVANSDYIDHKSLNYMDIIYHIKHTGYDH